MTKEKSAGSGTLVLPFPSPLHQEGERGESNISNPRVLSDMGLAIPRPTRLLPALAAGLGDPRSSSSLASVSCISISVGIPTDVGSKLLEPSRLAAAASRLLLLRFNFFLILYLTLFSFTELLFI
jgi:hypothetical protein